MTERLDRITVVGASLAGLRAVEALRREGFTGGLTLVGAERHLPYDRPPLSKQLLTGEWDIERVWLRPSDHYASLDIDLRLGSVAVGLDMASQSVALADGEVVPFDGLVIATGAVPRTLPSIPPLDGVLTLRTLDDSRTLAKYLARPGVRVVVVGGGFIGLEVAAAARSLNVDVTIVEATRTPLSTTLGSVAGAACVALHEANGVRFCSGVRVVGLMGDGRLQSVMLSDGTTLPADVVVIGVGVTPATDWLAGSGLAVESGLICDAGCFAAPGVVAAGDVARWWHRDLDRLVRTEHWTNAVEQGAHAATNLLRGAADSTAYVPVPYVWSDQYDRRMQLVGHVRPDDTVTVEGSVEDGEFLARYGGEPPSGVLALGMGREFLRHRRAITSAAQERASAGAH
jgi:NADPH-dependent 2,4-dienoyl-CoA reductase/sulfur reductase-like enzyme